MKSLGLKIYNLQYVLNNDFDKKENANGIEDNISYMPLSQKHELLIDISP